MSKSDSNISAAVPDYKDLGIAMIPESSSIGMGPIDESERSTLIPRRVESNRQIVESGSVVSSEVFNFHVSKYDSMVFSSEKHQPGKSSLPLSLMLNRLPDYLFSSARISASKNRFSQHKKHLMYSQPSVFVERIGDLVSSQLKGINVNLQINYANDFTTKSDEAQIPDV